MSAFQPQILHTHEIAVNGQSRLIMNSLAMHVKAPVGKRLSSVCTLISSTEINAASMMLMCVVQQAVGFELSSTC